MKSVQFTFYADKSEASADRCLREARESAGRIPKTMRNKTVWDVSPTPNGWLVTLEYRGIRKLDVREELGRTPLTVEDRRCIKRNKGFRRRPEPNKGSEK